jgi:hypothetical protein
MKLQVFIRSFGFPILVGVSLFFRIDSETKAFDVFGRITFFACVLLLALLSDYHYIQKVSLEGDRLMINYMTRFLQRKSIELPLADIAEVKLSPFKRFNLWSPTLTLKTEKKLMFFRILSKELHQDIQNQLVTANVAYVK